MCVFGLRGMWHIEKVPVNIRRDITLFERISDGILAKKIEVRYPHEC
jgi:hypothetical protein